LECHDEWGAVVFSDPDAVAGMAVESMSNSNSNAAAADATAATSNPPESQVGTQSGDTQPLALILRVRRVPAWAWACVWPAAAAVVRLVLRLLQHRMEAHKRNGLPDGAGG
jgi:hypothetical protein